MSFSLQNVPDCCIICDYFMVGFMPIYECHCLSCQTTFERLVRLGEKVLCCESCDSSRVKKIISRTNFQLQGTGWAKDSYNSPKPEMKDSKTDHQSN